MYREDISRFNVTKNTLKHLLMTSASAITMLATCQVSITHADDKKPTNITQEDLGTALLAFAQQRQINIIYDPKQLKGKISNEVSGQYSTPEVLQQLLTGSGYIYKTDKKGNFYIRKQHNDKTSDLNGFANRTYALAENSSYALNNGADTADNQGNNSVLIVENEKSDTDGAVSLEEIVVTGSNIRGARSASPVFIYDREDIEKTGLSTLPQFIRTLPQVFGGGASDGNIGISGANNAGLNIGKGTGINLRGLGTGSTLVLLDGRRMAAAGTGEFVDISIIPLTAIERVDVLTDGASAVYGSDAVGGVVNFILRDDYDGAETRVRYGSVTEGSSDELQIGQVFGKTWQGGNGLISYEFYQRSALNSESRNVTKNSPDPTDLLPKQKRHSIFMKARQDLTEKTELLGTAFYSTRDSEQFIANQFAPQTTFSDARSEQYGATIGIQTSINDSWQMGLHGTYNQNNTSNPQQLFAVPFSRGDTPLQEFDGQKVTSKVRTLEAKTDGTLFRLKGGEVKIAIGGQYRRESFGSPTIPLDSNRNTYALYGELFAPLISDENSQPGFERLEVTLATRYEHYSDFGATTDPKLGLLWSPVKGLNLRGTYGTSFRAPLLFELSEFNVSTFLFNVPDPDDLSQTIAGLLLFGNNSSLMPETATTWTAGIDLKPSTIPGLNIGITYFNIKFDNRIKAPGAFLDAFTDPNLEPLLTRNPDPEFIDFWTSIPQFFNFSSFNPSDIEIVHDGRLRNQSSVNTSGLDVSLSYVLDTDIGFWNFTLNGTYLFEKTEQLLKTSDFFDVIDTVHNPASLKLNGGISWSHDGFTTNLLVNHTGGYKDVRLDPTIDVDSFTTVDLNLSYNTEDRHNKLWLRDTIFSLSIINLFNQGPPFVKDLFNSNRNFDPDNATALGRFIAFQITRKW